MRAVRKWLSMPENEPPKAPIPNARAVTRRRTPPSLVWVIPILAAIVGAWVAVTRVLSEGPKITIVFDSAEGLEAGKTIIRYKGVEIGTITRIRLSEDHQRVVAIAQMEPRTEDFLVEDSTFWVVRPRISGANVTGLGTLISGAYIGVEIGRSKIHKAAFVALETPPVVTGGPGSGKSAVLARLVTLSNPRYRAEMPWPLAADDPVVNLRPGVIVQQQRYVARSRRAGELLDQRCRPARHPGDQATEQPPIAALGPDCVNQADDGRNQDQRDGNGSVRQIRLGCHRRCDDEHRPPITVTGQNCQARGDGKCHLTLFC